MQIIIFLLHFPVIWYSPVFSQSFSCNLFYFSSELSFLRKDLSSSYVLVVFLVFFRISHMFSWSQVYCKLFPVIFLIFSIILCSYSIFIVPNQIFVSYSISLLLLRDISNSTVILYIICNYCSICIRVQWFFKTILGTCHVVPNCCRAPIPKFHFFMLPLSLGAGKASEN